MNYVTDFYCYKNKKMLGTVFLMSLENDKCKIVYVVGDMLAGLAILCY